MHYSLLVCPAGSQNGLNKFYHIISLLWLAYHFALFIVNQLLLASILRFVIHKL